MANFMNHGLVFIHIHVKKEKVKLLLHWLPDDALVMTTRLLIAAVLGGLVGLEREVKGHPAGFRTHLLVSIGACLMMLLSIYGFTQFLSNHPSGSVRIDPGRLPSYVVSGIGFLGAGTILVHGVTVRGLTTAASIWVVAGIGLVVGDGMYYVAILTTVIVILSLLFLNKWENLFFNAPKSERLYIVVENKSVPLSKVVESVQQYIVVKKAAVEDYPDNGEKDFIKYALTVQAPEKGIPSHVYDELSKSESVYKVYTTH